jgi:hypothetical protein
MVPVVILAPIPLSLIGIIPGHGLLGAFFTATSMIGFIAGAGIIVRNSIILVDFIELKLREGMALEAAVVEAGVVRFRPMPTQPSPIIPSSRDAPAAGASSSHRAEPGTSIRIADGQYEI